MKVWLGFSSRVFCRRKCSILGGATPAFIGFFRPERIGLKLVQRKTYDHLLKYDCLNDKTGASDLQKKEKEKQYSVGLWAFGVGSWVLDVRFVVCVGRYFFINRKLFLINIPIQWSIFLKETTPFPNIRDNLQNTQP